MGYFNGLEVGYWVYKGVAEKPAGRVVEIQVAEGKCSDYDENPEVTAIVIEVLDDDGLATGETVTIPADEWMAWLTSGAGKLD